MENSNFIPMADLYRFVLEDNGDTFVPKMIINGVQKKLKLLVNRWAKEVKVQVESKRFDINILYNTKDMITKSKSLSKGLSVRYSHFKCNGLEQQVVNCYHKISSNDAGDCKKNGMYHYAATSCESTNGKYFC